MKFYYFMFSIQVNKATAGTKATWSMSWSFQIQ